jgi:hypothetical protein
MYTESKGTLNARPYREVKQVVMTHPSIQTLDKRKDCFYGAFKTSENGPLVILPSAVEPFDVPHVDLRLWDKAAVFTFKSSVIFLTADKRGIQLECHATNKKVILFVQWKELNVLKLDESHFDIFLGYIKQGMLKKHFNEIVMQPNKIRKAIFKVINAISCGLGERYDIGGGFTLGTGKYGEWEIRKGNKLIYPNVCLEQITPRTQLT